MVARISAPLDESRESYEAKSGFEKGRAFVFLASFRPPNFLT